MSVGIYLHGDRKSSVVSICQHEPGAQSCIVCAIEIQVKYRFAVLPAVKNWNGWIMRGENEFTS